MTTHPDPPKPAGTGPVFFLSYPRPSAAERFWSADGDYVAFYHELCAALARLVPLDRLHGLGALSPEWEPAGTAATQQRPSSYITGTSDASERAARDIAECDVFVPLHSPRYFESDACGRELAAFETRVARSGGERSAAILPVLWAPVSPQWDVSQPPPYRSGQTDIDDEYLAKGLIWLQSTYPARYRKVVADLARRVADISSGRPVDRGPATDPATLRSALRKAERQPLTVVLLAGTADRPGYGPSPLTWAPFSGGAAGAEGAAEPLAGRLAALARAKGWEPRVVPFSEADLRLAADAEPETQAVLVVDVRALDDPRRREALERFDALDTPGVGVVAVLDPEGTPPPEQARLRDQLTRVLDRKFARRSPSLRLSAPVATSLRMLDQALDATANATRIRLAGRTPARSHPAEEENPS